MADVTRLIGIDFGTSTSLVRVKRYEGGKPIGGAVLSAGVTFGNGQDDIRALTVVRREGDGKVTCGREAEEPLPESTVYREFKMDLESPDEAKRAQARDLTGEFFKYLYRWYDHQRSNLGEAGDRERTVVSFPVKWSAETRDFMVQAAKVAGFPEVTSMDEASAALSATLVNKMNDVKAMGYLRPGEPGTMLLIDMGAGTTDLAVCRYSVDGAPDGVVQVGRIRNEIVATWPESADAPTFGGREVDELLAGYLTDYLCACGLDASMAGQLVRGTGAVRPWKEHSVSALLAEDKSVASCGFLAGYMMLLPRKMPFPAIDRAGFEALVHDKLEDFKSLITGCLDRAARLDPTIAERGVDLVVLTGGHSSWYFTKDLLTGAMPGLTHPALKQVRSEPDRVLRLPNPQETVSLGLVYSLLPLKMEKPKNAAPAKKTEAAVDRATSNRQSDPDLPLIEARYKFIKEWPSIAPKGEVTVRNNRLPYSLIWRHNGPEEYYFHLYGWGDEHNYPQIAIETNHMVKRTCFDDRPYEVGKKSFSEQFAEKLQQKEPLIKDPAVIEAMRAFFAAFDQVDGYRFTFYPELKPKLWKFLKDANGQKLPPNVLERLKSALAVKQVFYAQVYQGGFLQDLFSYGDFGMICNSGGVHIRFGTKKYPMKWDFKWEAFMNMDLLRTVPSDSIDFLKELQEFLRREAKLLEQEQQ